ncbi:MAG: rane protein [Candidatus Saccharibacteria bacterium]|nr:rane protein [Candidatus Saccharibacteria bacterium]
MTKVTKHSAAQTKRQLQSKVPEIIIFFWIIKILCTTVGETAADFLNMNLDLGLSVTTFLMSTLLIIALIVQFATRRYVPAVYWIAVVLISVVGTLITDNLTDVLAVPLAVSSIVFATALAITFALWYRNEKTLSIHSINTSKREAYYWLVVLLAFALGTAVGDMIAEQFNFGYLPSFFLFGVVTGLIVVGRFVFKLNVVFAFWAAYILTRPLGASLGDFLSQPTDSGGLSLGTTVTSFIFLGLILILVTYLIFTKRDVVTENA